MKRDIKNKADETKQFSVPIETEFEMIIPSEVIDVLELGRGDSIKFIQEDNGEVYLRKA
jgi:hypothetical protein